MTRAGRSWRGATLLRTRALSATLLVGFVLALPVTAQATWPMARHDAKRVGSTTGTANLSAPTPYWRTYLGGSIAGNQLLTADANGDGTLDFLVANAGLVSALQTTNQVIWKSPPLAIEAFAGVGDLNGDGTLDIVAYSRDHVIVFAVDTGAVEWQEPDGEMGTIGGVRVGDLTGDGNPDVLVVECGCCAVDSGNSGFFWSFGGGFASAQRLGSLPVFACSTSNSVTLVQADATEASTQYETLAADDSHFALTSDDGTVLAQTGTIGTNTASNVCMTANIDGTPGDEMACLLNSSDAPAVNQRRITVLHYDYTMQPPALDVLWSNVVAPDAGGDMHWVDPLVDLDGDGLFEMVVSTDDPVNGWETHVYDALSGADLVQPLAGQTVAGTAPMEAMNLRVLLTSSGTTVTGWVFTRSPSPSVTMQWSEPNVGVLTYPSPTEFPLQSISAQVLATDLNGDGLADAVMTGLSASATADLVAFSSAGGTVAQVATLELPSNVDLLTTWIVPPMTISTPQVAMARSDGIVNLLDDGLQKTTAGTPAAEVDVQVGGYYATGAWRELYHAPRVVALGSGPAQSVVVDDSRSALLRFDAATASWALPPTATWQVTHTFGPSVVAGASGSNPVMGCLAFTEPVTNPPQYRARIVNADGSLGWDIALSGAPLADLAPGNFSDGPVPDFALQLGNPSNLDLNTIALSGSNGSLLWTTEPMYPGAGGIQSAGVSVADWNGDMIDDVYFQGAPTYVLSGVDGAQLASGGPTNTYSLPLLYDTTGDGTDEVTFTASLWPVTIYSHDLQTALWTSPDNDLPYPYGAVAQCPGSPAPLILVEGSWQNPSRLKLTPLNGSSLGAFTTMVLAGGSLYPSEATATAAGAFLGQLTSANVHSDLTGQNRPSAVVGSDDGWLYGVNPCAGTLDFAVPIGAAVGEAVFGDTDGDGNDEILVTAADGYLYDLKGFSIAAPAYVWDTDPPAVTNHEVSSIVTTNELSAAWGSVTGATSYAVQVVTSAGDQPVSTPLWQNVGNVTAISLYGLPLKDDTKYLFAVRAIGPDGPSVDAVSSGVTVHFPSDAGVEGGLDAGADASLDAGKDSGSSGGGPGGGGCGCRTVESGPLDGRLVGIGALPIALVVRRRRVAHRRQPPT
jgi:FG-GAP-like repeat